MFPLPSDSFDIEPLSLKRRDQYLDYIHNEIDSALLLCNDLGHIKWRGSRQKEGVNIARANVEGKNHTAVRGTCNIQASFDEVMNVLITEDTKTFRHVEACANEIEFMDGMVVHVLKERTAEHPNRFACIKWHCLKSLSPSIAKHRDFVYVEAVDEFIDKEGQRIGYRLSKSVQLSELGSLEESHQLIRAKAFNLHTFKQIVSGEGEVIELMSMSIGDHKGRLPSWLLTKMADVAGQRGANIRRYIDSQRLSLLKFTRPEKWIQLNDRSNCAICTRGFSLVRKKHNCRSCGEVICSQCSAYHEVLVKHDKKVKTRLCVRCNIKARKLPLPAPVFDSENVARESALHSTDRYSTASTVSNDAPDPRLFKGERHTVEISDPSKQLHGRKNPQERSTVSGSNPTSGPDAARTPESAAGAGGIILPSRQSENVIDLGIGKYKEPSRATISNFNLIGMGAPQTASSVLLELPGLNKPTRMSIPSRPPLQRAQTQIELEEPSAMDFMSQIDKITADLDKIDLGIISASSLSKPASPPPPPPKTAEPEASFSSFLRDSTVGVDIEAGEEEDDLPEGWKSIMSSTGKVYFYNETCGSTQWTRPEDDIERSSEAYAVL